MQININSNHVFKGFNVSIQKHWTGEWEIIDTKTSGKLRKKKGENRHE